MKTKIWRIGIRIFGDSDVVNKLIDAVPSVLTKIFSTKFLISQFFQDGEIDASKYVQSSEEIDLPKRTFKTRQFFDDNKVTPAGLSFFQSDWDSTLTKFFHHTLNMREPRYEYDFPPYYTKPWVEKNPRQ